MRRIIIEWDEYDFIYRAYYDDKPKGDEEVVGDTPEEALRELLEVYGNWLNEEEEE